MSRRLIGDSFDPEGSGYDYGGAGFDVIRNPATGKMGSRNPRTGQILKGRKHPTYKLTEREEKKQGYVIGKLFPKGKYTSYKPNRKKVK
jgi:hypothetical protein